MRHTPDHDSWGLDGRCDALILEPDGSLTRCGAAPQRASFDRAQEPLIVPVPGAGNGVRNVVVGIVMGVIGLAVAFDWLAFWLYVARNEVQPGLAGDFVVRVGVSVLYGAAVLWLWRRR